MPMKEPVFYYHSIEQEIRIEMTLQYWTIKLTFVTTSKSRSS